MNLLSGLLMCTLLFQFLGIRHQKPIIPSSIYEFKIPLIGGDILDLGNYKDKKILIVNVASRCGFTPQYTGLEKLSQIYKDKLLILGFPANNFLWQEPGNNEEIGKFCTLNYGVTFPIAEKISVKGCNKSPIYTWLTNLKYNQFKDSKVRWNFQKYLIDENGNLIGIFDPSTDPLSEEVIALIEK